MLGPTDTDSLAYFILRIALSNPDSSDTTNSVLQAVFAVASLQLHGSSSAHTFRYKGRAVSKISTEATESLDEGALLRNLVATMLLYHYEVSVKSLTSPVYSSGSSGLAVLEVMDACPADHIHQNSWLHLARDLEAHGRSSSAP